jgi:hypothetical protein
MRKSAGTPSGRALLQSHGENRQAMDVGRDEAASGLPLGLPAGLVHGSRARPMPPLRLSEGGKELLREGGVRELSHSPHDA